MGFAVAIERQHDGSHRFDDPSLWQEMVGDLEGIVYRIKQCQIFDSTSSMQTHNMYNILDVEIMYNF